MARTWRPRLQRKILRRQNRKRWFWKKRLWRRQSPCPRRIRFSGPLPTRASAAAAGPNDVAEPVSIPVPVELRNLQKCKGLRLSGIAGTHLLRGMRREAVARPAPFAAGGRRRPKGASGTGTESNPCHERCAGAFCFGGFLVDSNIGGSNLFASSFGPDRGTGRRRTSAAARG